MNVKAAWFSVIYMAGLTDKERRSALETNKNETKPD